MFKILMSLLLAFSLSACAGTLTTPTTQPSAITSAQTAAENSLYAIGTALQATPGILNALYDAGKLSKDDFNKAVPVYNQALASFQLAVTALKTAKDAGADPNMVAGYTTALAAFMTDKANIDNLVTAFGKTPAGGAL